MEFTIDKAILQKELGVVTPVIERKNGPMPILKHLRIEANQAGKIRITGSDGDTTLLTEAEARIIKGGACLIPAISFNNLTRQLPAGSINIKAEANDRVKISIEDITARLAGVPVDSFPQTPKTETAGTELPADVLKTMIDATIFSVTTDESRFQLAGAKFIVDTKSAQMISTDGHRLSFIKNIEVGSKQKLSVLIPRKSLSELSKMAGAHDGNVTVQVDENHAIFRFGERTLITRLLAGQFPNYKTAIPQDHERAATMSGAELAESLRRMSVLATDIHHKVVFGLSPNSLTLASTEGELGEAVEKRKISYEGNEFKIGFNANYLSDFLNATAGAELTLQLKGSQAQAVFIPNMGPQWDCRFVLCPVRV